MSGLLDAQAMVVWDRATWDIAVPGGATGTVQVRNSSTSTPDATWTTWTRVPANGQVAGTSRYLQYRVQFAARAGAKARSPSAIGFSSNGDMPARAVEGR
ncbi:MAG: hypothetical protein J2P23_07225 [Microlunatus sp.]|nr:hypothetical protein [Microlunatus sp.]